MKKIIFLFTFLFSSSLFANSIVLGDAYIYNVVDGDTFDVKTSPNNVRQLLQLDYIDKKWINLNKGLFRIRLSNVNTEESKHKDSSKNTTFGKQTSSIVKNKYSNTNVSFRCYEKGYYGRAVCSVKYSHEDIGLWLIKNNYSKYIKQYGKHPEMHLQYQKASLSNNKIIKKVRESERGKKLLSWAKNKLQEKYNQ